MLELLSIFCGSFIIALSGAMMPGPLLTVTIVEAAQSGFWAGPLLVVGHGILELTLVIAIILGLGPWLKSPPIMSLIALAGGGMLFWMGYSMFKGASQLSLNNDLKYQDTKRLNPICNGLLASLANPYWILWWATIGLGYLVAAMKFALLGIVCFFTGHILADLAWYSLVSLGISQGKQFLPDRSYQTMIRICALILIGFGIYFLQSFWSIFSSNLA